MYKIFLLILVSFQVHAQIIDTPNLESCFINAKTATQRVDPSRILYVFDIDNTVLTQNQHLGSVQWFRWQAQLIQKGIDQDRVANNITDLLTAQGKIYHLSQAHTPETGTASSVSSLQNLGSRIIYHTSRSTSVRDITERDLMTHRLLPIKNTIGPDSGFSGTFTYADWTPHQKPVSFQNGVYMTGGQDKGLWLEMLLSKTLFTPEHIVFVDDERKNLENVERAFVGKISLTLCRYSRLDDLVSEFNRSDKRAEIRMWNDLLEIFAKFR